MKGGNLRKQVACPDLKFFWRTKLIAIHLHFKDAGAQTKEIICSQMNSFSLPFTYTSEPRFGDQQYGDVHT